MKALPVLLVLVSFFSGCGRVKERSTGSAANSTNVNVNPMSSSENSMSERDIAINSVKIEKAEGAQTGDITVQILNLSKKPIRLWKDSNSWGAGRWRVLLLRRGRLETFFQIASQIFTLNRPTFNEIAAGGRLEQKLNLNGGNWCGLGHCTQFYERGFGGTNITFEPTDTVIVIYDVPVTQEALENKVWYGVIGATAGVAPNGSLKAEGTNPNRSNSKMNGNENSVLTVEKSMNALKIDKVEISRTAQVTMMLENSSKEPLRVWKDSNSWGAACWRLMRIRNGSLEVFFQNPDQIFTKNWPTFTTIAGGEHIEYKLDLNGGNWCGFGHCTRHNERGFGSDKLTFDSMDMVIVMYDVPATQEARDNGVWYGVVAATTVVQ